MKFFYKDCFLFHHDSAKKQASSEGAYLYGWINDYKQAFLHGKSISEAFHLVPEVVETIKNSVERVLINEAGAKTVMVSGVPPMGCFPGFRALFPDGDSIGKIRSATRD
ncbi:hypothetical protein BC332_33649 [Capsicum chinense]|nr:hypothetical protein BC332_33649 [Capsicum chinense]